MKKHHQHINKVGRLIVDSLLVLAFLAMLAVPVSSITLLRVANNSEKQVLSAQQKKNPDVSDESKSYRPVIYYDETNETTESTQQVEVDR